MPDSAMSREPYDCLVSGIVHPPHYSTGGRSGTCQRHHIGRMPLGMVALWCLVLDQHSRCRAGTELAPVGGDGHAWI